MIEPRSYRLAFLGVALLVGLCLAASAAPVKVRTVVDNASVKASPEIGAKSLVKLPLNSTLEVKDKQGEWYKVSFEKDGATIEGYIHEMLVEDAPGETAVQEPAVKSAEEAKPDLSAEIESAVDSAKESIRQEKGLAGAQESLDGLLAKVFNISDQKRQRSLAVEIYLWLGIARLAGGDSAAGLREFKKMFDVDPVVAKEATRNIATPKVDALLKLAEQESLGLISDFNLEVSSDPAPAEVYVDGRDLGSTPGTFRLTSPKFVLEVKKTGFVPVREDVFLTAASAKKEYKLELMKRELALTSEPTGAAVFLDGKDAGKVTDCRLEGLAFGPHELRLTKSHYLDWSGSVNVTEDPMAAVHVNLIGRSYVSLAKWGERGSGLVQSPAALAKDRDGSLYVFDESESRVKKFTADGQSVPDWKIQAPELRDMKNPAAMAIDGQGTMYLVDARRGLILKVGQDGRSASRWNGSGGGTSEFRLPAGIAFDSADRIYVVEAGNNRVKKYSGRGEFVKTWGAEGTGNGQFVTPRAVAVSPKDEVYVLDKTRVQKFSGEGEFLLSWGKSGSGDGQFQNPLGLAVDAAGCVYVADTDNHRVQKFDGNGRFITRWGSKGKENGQLLEPVAVLADSRGYVYVLEKGNERVQVFGVGVPGSQR
jgi:DNA-binding beta-propeller fold protein YncE